MDLKRLLSEGKLQKHKTSQEELSKLRELIERNLKDAAVEGLSSDRRFATAYNAALQSAALVLYTEGYKPHGFGHHFTTFEAARQIMGKEYDGLFDYFDSCRVKRNRVDYDFAGEVSETETEELVKEAKKFSKICFEPADKYIKKNKAF